MKYLSRWMGAWLALGFAPLLVPFFINLWGREPYQFFPLAMAGAGFLAWSRLPQVASPLGMRASWGAVGLLAVSLPLLIGAIVLWSPWLGAVAMFFALLAAVWWLGGWSLFRAMLPACLLLLLIIPPPLNLDTRLTLKLRALAVAGSGRVLDWLGVTHLVVGNVIEIPGRRLLVEEACSGINSVLFVSAVCLFYTLWRRRSLLHVLVGVGLAVSFVLLGNMVRITAGAWLWFHHHLDILSGWSHEAVGLALLTGYLVLVFSLDQLLLFLAESLGKQPGAEAQPASASAVPTVAHRISPGRAWGVTVVFALLGGAQIASAWIHHRQGQQRAVSEGKIPFMARIGGASALKTGATFSMPESIGPWQRLSTEMPLLHKVETSGVSSQIWHYKNDRGTIASIALDYPFRGYHDVTACYTAQGWQMRERSRRPAREANGRIPHVEVQMRKDTLRWGSLWFSTFDEQGRWHEEPEMEMRRDFLQRFKNGSDLPTTCRVQALVTGYTPLEQAERDEVLRLFAVARKQLAAQLLGQTN